MSSTLDEMVKTKKGYRTENFSGSMVRDLKEVIRYELSMGNIDIVCYMKRKHGILSVYDLEEEQINELKKQHMNDKEYKDAYKEDFLYMCEENSSDITKKIINFACLQLSVKSVDELIAIWLTNYKDVVNIYNNKVDDDIDEYELPDDDNFLVLSDLENEGSLFVYKKNQII